MTTEEILTSAVFQDSMFALIISVLVFLLSHFLCSVQGMGRNKIGKVARSLAQAERSLELFLAGVNDGKLERERARKLLLQIRLRVRNSSSVLQVYLYEGYDNPTAGQIISKLYSVENECGDVAVDYNDGKRDEMIRHLENMKKTLGMAAIMLSEVKKDIEEESKKVI